MSKWKTTLATVTNQLILGSINLWTDQKSCIWRTEFCDFKMNVIKWQLNFLLRNFGLKSYLWFLSKSHYALVRFRNYSYDEIRRSSQLRTLLKRVVVSRTWKKFQARTGFEPMTSAIPILLRDVLSHNSWHHPEDNHQRMQDYTRHSMDNYQKLLEIIIKLINIHPKFFIKPVLRGPTSLLNSIFM